MRLFAGTQWDRPPVCERCGRPESECQCPAPEPASTFLPPSSQTARLAVERRKKGKVVTVVRGLSPAESDFAALLTTLKNSCGAGGSVDAETLEIQGDHLDRLQKLLREMGYQVK